METIPNLRRVALAEASSFLLLLVATIVKYSSDEPIGVKILGPIHGLLFLAYVFLAVMLAKPQGWTTRQLVLILLGAVITSWTGGWRATPAACQTPRRCRRARSTERGG